MGVCDIPPAGHGDCRDRVVREDPGRITDESGFQLALGSSPRVGVVGCITPSPRGTASPSGSCRVADAVSGLREHSREAREHRSPRSSCCFSTLPLCRDAQFMTCFLSAELKPHGISQRLLL